MMLYNNHEATNLANLALIWNHPSWVFFAFALWGFLLVCIFVSEIMILVPDKSRKLACFNKLVYFNDWEIITLRDVGINQKRRRFLEWKWEKTVILTLINFKFWPYLIIRYLQKNQAEVIGDWGGGYGCCGL